MLEDTRRRGGRKKLEDMSIAASSRHHIRCGAQLGLRILEALDGVAAEEGEVSCGIIT